MSDINFGRWSDKRREAKLPCEMDDTKTCNPKNDPICHDCHEVDLFGLKRKPHLLGEVYFGG